MEGEDQGATVIGGQAKDAITGEAKTVDITRVPLNFLPMTGKLDRGARGLSPAVPVPLSHILSSLTKEE